MADIYKSILGIRSKPLRNFLLTSYTLAAVFLISAIIAIPLLFLLYLVAKYIIIPAVMIVCCFIPWLIESCKQQ